LSIFVGEEKSQGYGPEKLSDSILNFCTEDHQELYPGCFYHIEFVMTATHTHELTPSSQVYTVSVLTSYMTAPDW